jgi:hypothetical protein
MRLKEDVDKGLPREYPSDEGVDAFKLFNEALERSGAVSRAVVEGI